MPHRSDISSNIYTQSSQSDSRRLRAFAAVQLRRVRLYRVRSLGRPVNLNIARLADSKFGSLMDANSPVICRTLYQGEDGSIVTRAPSIQITRHFHIKLYDGAEQPALSKQAGKEWPWSAPEHSIMSAP